MSGILKSFTIEQRLLAKRTITPSNCWEWNGGRDRNGYGRIRVNPFATRFVHRFSAWVWNGINPDSPIDVLHDCDNPRCFNPAHLFTGTQADYVRDMIAKGRSNFTAPTAKINKTKTHCPQGHPYDDANTYLYNGHRMCKACMKDRNRQATALLTKEDRMKRRDYLIAWRKRKKVNKWAAA